MVAALCHATSALLDGLTLALVSPIQRVLLALTALLLLLFTSIACCSYSSHPSPAAPTPGMPGLLLVEAHFDAVLNSLLDPFDVIHLMSRFCDQGSGG